MAGKKPDGIPCFNIGAVVNPASENADLQLMMMEKKAAAGAVFFQTQPVFDVGQYRIFADRAKHLPVKIIPGVALLKSAAFVNFLRGIPGITIPDEVARRMEAAPDQLKEGITICAETIRELKKISHGVHIMAIGMEAHIPEILSKIA